MEKFSMFTSSVISVRIYYITVLGILIFFENINIQYFQINVK